MTDCAAGTVDSQGIQGAVLVIGQRHVQSHGTGQTSLGAGGCLPHPASAVGTRVRAGHGTAGGEGRRRAPA